MGAKKAMLKVIADGIEVGAHWYHNGQVLQVSQAKAEELLKSMQVERV
jgi:hypothetical protein